MVIVFYLSEPVDFSPVYDFNIPVELIELYKKEKNILDKLTGQFMEYFPEADYFVLDGGINPSYYKVSGSIDSLNLPSSNLFSRLFLFSAFSNANSLPPFTVFVPGNLEVADFEKLSSAIRKAAGNPVSSSGFTFFTAFEGDFEEYAEIGETIVRDDNFILNRFKDFIASAELKKRLEKNENLIKRKLFSGNLNIFSFNNIKISESLEGLQKTFNKTEDIGEINLLSLYYLLTESWRDGRSINTVLSEAILNLNTWDFKCFVKTVDEKFSVSVDAGYLEIKGLTGLLDKLPVDENGNFILGKANIKNITNSIIINKSDQILNVSNMNRALVISKNGIVRIDCF